MGWAGWGTGPSGAGAMRTSRVFLVLMLVACVALVGIALSRHELAPAGVGGIGVVYFALRLAGVLGGRR